MKQQILNLIDERIAHLAAYQWTDGKWSERVGDCEVGMRELRSLKEQVERLREPEGEVSWSDPVTGQVWVRSSIPGHLVSDDDQFLWDPSDCTNPLYRRACAALWPNFDLPAVEYKP